tara:strand:- start:549 stop:1625 length:1077 start_codon:yes stop_codon:yes gene_type:complete
MLSDGLSLTASLREVQERSLASYKDQLSEISLTGTARAAVQGLYDKAEKRLVETIGRQNKISAMYQKYVDPEGEIPWGDTPEERNILTDLAVMNAASIAKDEIVGMESMATEQFDVDTDALTDVQRSTNLENKDSIIETQIKIINESISGKAEPLSDKQKKLFRDTVESYVESYTSDRPYLSDPRRRAAEGRTDEDIAAVLERRPASTAADRSDLWRDTTDEPMSIGERAIRSAFKWLTEGLREGIETKEELPFFAETQDPSVQKEIAKLSTEGRLFWTTLGEAIEDRGLEAALSSLAEQFESLSNSDKEIMHGLNSGIPSNKSFFSDPANIFGASNGANTPAVEDAIAMLFNPKSIS